MSAPASLARVSRWFGLGLVVRARHRRERQQQQNDDEWSREAHDRPVIGAWGVDLHALLDA